MERSGGKSRLRIHRRRREYNIKMDLKKVNGAWTGLIWLRIGTGDGFLWMRGDSSGFVK